MSFTVSIQLEDFDLTTEVSSLRAADPGVGAVCSFVGTVREFDAKTDQATQAAQPNSLDALYASFDIPGHPPCLTLQVKP